jgi:pyruvate,orthophosphate dikinase
VKWVYTFEEGHAGMRDLLGGKGSALAEMTRIGLPVPPGFTITTAACVGYLDAGGRYPEGLEDQVAAALAGLEARMGRRFGDRGNPLLVSVRSGAAISMPGMMDTILNLGLNDETVEGLAAGTGDRRFALDSYRRFIQMFGNVVLHIPHARFEEILQAELRREGVRADAELSPSALERVIAGYKAVVPDFPQDVRRQLDLAIRAVFASWRNDRAIVYRRIHKIPDDLGTAVNVQAMVFGNRGPDSGTGVLFTRDPSTGERRLVGEYLPNAQGEDVVAGIRTPEPIDRLQADLPGVYAELKRVASLLEEHYGDMQDIEFTVEQGRLFLLQTRSAKRTPRAAIRVAHDLVVEGRIGREEALLRIEPRGLEGLLQRTFDPGAPKRLLGRGLPASPGAAVGEVVFDPDEAEEAVRQGRRVVLVRPETTPDDIHGIAVAEGVLTSRGGMTSHAAIVTRGMGKPCVVGCDALTVDVAAGEAWIEGVRIARGDVLSIDGSTGEVFAGAVPLVDPDLGPELEEVLSWADAFRRLGVWANADTPQDARRARELGAGGIGLVRTEHMFMAPERLPAVQAMIVSRTEEERRRHLDVLLPMQEADFEGIFRAMAGLPVTIRLLDPPLHEFLPDTEALAEEVRRLRETGENPARLAEAEELLHKARALAEVNPMLGHRGVRLAITFPEIYEMQCRAIFRAAARLSREGVAVRPEIMFPLIGLEGEMKRMRELADRVAQEVFAELGVSVPYAIGACIEVPRGCLVAEAIAEHAEFFSYGTNDLTQTCFGFSRDDAEAKFLHQYLQQKLLPANPFESLDPEGVGRLMEIGTRGGRSVRPNLKVGVCGEQGGDPASIELCHRLGLDYVSVSPPRVPVARLAAAQAALRERREVPVAG